MGMRGRPCLSTTFVRIRTLGLGELCRHGRRRSAHLAELTSRLLILPYPFSSFVIIYAMIRDSGKGKQGSTASTVSMYEDDENDLFTDLKVSQGDGEMAR